MSFRGRIIRLGLMLVTLYFVIDWAFNRQYTFGSTIRDTAFGAVAWHLFAKTLDVGLVYDLEGKPPPRWCVPVWQRVEDGRANEASVAERKGKRTQHHVAHASAAKPSFWQRTPLPGRPAWARQQKLIPQQWRLLDLPTSAADRALWALDVMFMRRLGTSWLFIEEMRALEWSKSKLEHAGAVQSEARRTGQALPRYKAELQPFGYSEGSWWYAILDASLFGWAIVYVSQSHVPVKSRWDFYHLPFAQQAALTLCVGVIIGMPAALPEMIFIPLTQIWPLNLPATAIIPTFRDVGRSRSLSELWGFRWHTISKRDFVRLARLLPIGGSRNKAALLVKVFFWSGLFHSILLTRVTPPPSLSDAWSIYRIFFLPGPMLFFLSQAFLILFEQSVSAPLLRLLGAYPASKEIPPWKGALIQVGMNLWTWTAMLATGRWLAAEVVGWNLFDRQQILTMRPAAQLRDYADFFKRNLA
ncbi:hypothetical protein IE81DRAFT_348951 [Ceraceosorus guamensis]|uniref:Wax synthase domain-containing protein n=1 Tax=Ceraceosorus guamensis TaxID=1522189 RepID=A0A316VTH4_9BASI|nr:hypothetical protein IE81DRAFT_348951 [Ceraceosorus guamensis]PWN40792.1 hypothetical protein IE81DRAFT_348951 [Ceraceosorus guamensis]